MKFKKSVIALVVMIAVVGSSCLQAMKRVGGQVASVAAKGAAVGFTTRSFGNDSPFLYEKVVTPVNQEILNVGQPKADQVLKTRWDGYKQAYKDMKEMTASKLPDYDYAGFKQSAKFAGKAGAAGALAGGLAMNYYLGGGDEAKFQNALLQMKLERKEHFNEYEQAFVSAPSREGMPTLLKVYYRYLELLDRKELEDEYLGGVDQFIQLQEQAFDEKWGKVLRRSKKDDLLRDSEKHDLDEKTSEIINGVSSMRKQPREKIISDLLSVKNLLAEHEVQKAEMLHKLFLDSWKLTAKSAKSAASEMAKQSVQAIKKRGSKIVTESASAIGSGVSQVAQGSASAVGSGVSKLADSSYDAAKSGASSLWDWIASKDKEAERELAKI